MSRTPPDPAGRPPLAFGVILPDALDQPPLTLSVAGLRRSEMAAWIAGSQRVFRFSAAVSSVPDAELHVRAGAFTSRWGATSAARTDHPVRLLSGRPAILGCGPHRLVLEQHGADVLELADPGDKGLETASRALLDVWLQRALAARGVAVLHGVAFRVGSHGPLAVGGRRAGKSTIAAAAIMANGRVVSDDWLLAGVTRDGAIVVVPGRTEIAFRSPTVAVLPDDVRSRLVAVPDDPDRLTLSPSPEDSWYADSLNPTSIWQLSIDRRLCASRLQPTSQGGAWVALARSTSAVFLSGLFRRERSCLVDTLQRLVAECDGFRVRLGRDLLTEPAADLARLLTAADVERFRRRCRPRSK